MYNSTNNSHQRGNRAAAFNTSNKNHGALTTDEGELQDFEVDDYDINHDDDDDDDEGNDDENDQFSPHQRMPTQHPATRTCFQLLGKLSVLI